VWDKSPEDIRTIHEQKLAAMGVGPGTVRAFVTNRWFTPTLSVPFVEHLAQLPAANGRAAVVALASSVASEGEARFMLNAVTMAREIGRNEILSLPSTWSVGSWRFARARVEWRCPHLLTMSSGLNL